MRTIRDLDIKDKKVLVRVDYNVPIKSNKVENDLRIQASLPTIKYLLDQGAKQIFLISHLGRPEGKPNPKLSLKPVLDSLKKLLPELKNHIEFAPLPNSNQGNIKSNAKIILLENLRFDPSEENNSTDFARSIANYTEANLFIQDGFAVLHRAHASTEAITKLMPSGIGFLVEKEVENLTKVSKNPAHPALLIIGGAKVEDKAPLIEKFTKKFDQIAVGGKIAADGYQNKNPKIYTASDFDEDNTGAKLDIGPVSTGEITNKIVDAKTIIWNGLLGYAEDPAYATSSTIVAELIGEKEDATTVICGGDTTAFVEAISTKHPNLHYSLISTGGGASLEFLLSGKLPGLEAIKRASL
ncbi:phosphoglycerate kinase [Candidatus Saccharibacteria bacterium]|nr:phosphoglycerate kinase [Candidatus Saccharibacteria bacterium]